VRRLARSVARKVKGSSNRAKAKLKLARLHERIAHSRRDGLHKLTTDLTRRFHTIGIEDLNVKGMLKNHRLARAIADMGFHEFRRQLEYKTALHGAQRGHKFDAHGGKFYRHCLWRGRRWPCMQVQGETGPDEAGIQRQS
jgi:IS605 OrfB family transposase